jgi:hypothetical protein
MIAAVTGLGSPVAADSERLQCLLRPPWSATDPSQLKRHQPLIHLSCAPNLMIIEESSADRPAAMRARPSPRPITHREREQSANYGGCRSL